MNMGNPLPPPVAEADFYRLFWILAIITLTIAVVALFRRLRLHREHDGVSSFPVAYEWLARGLGALWLLDGLLQAQPLMITRFIGGFLAPLIQGQPALLRSLIEIGVRLWGINPVMWNEFATWIQIDIGLLILLGSVDTWRRVGLWLSVAWGLVVWIGGEAMGSLFSGGSWLSGSPGSVILYVLLALLLLLSPSFWQSSRPTKIFQYGLAGLWGLSALLQAWPASGFWQGQSMSAYVLSMAEMPQPGIFSEPLYAWANSLAAHPALWNAVLVITFSILAILWLIRPKSVVTWWLTTVVTFATWWLGQDFGVLGGMGTDPNSGVLVLLSLAVYARLATVPIFGRSLFMDSTPAKGRTMS
ncbi:MAG: hypothetical protein C7B47_09620 [Sulfobacillus thermosulfidooxidans]|uniref:Uncharacterized protein n=1 Tax=Sulfobacillus thermosulfidooxidans TaxID=28034 RepID=A0A2T2WX75_SULTH|nr:MAG: hypothetical protein C7B47_09620 [Sulfobacillus thermosulfidooxidans]